MQNYQRHLQSSSDVLETLELETNRITNERSVDRKQAVDEQRPEDDTQISHEARDSEIRTCLEFRVQGLGFRV